MRRVRAILRLLGFFLITSAAWVARVLTRPLCRNHPERNRRWRGAIFQAWGRCILGNVGASLRAEGTPPLPPGLLVSNHLSYLDIATLSSRVNAVFVSRHDVQAWPFLGPIVKQFDTIFINRERLRDIVVARRAIDAALARGETVLFFPEGTSSNGDQVLQLKQALLDLAVRGGHPVYTAALYYRTPEGEKPARESVCWWGDMAFMPHLMQMLEIPRFFANLRFSELSVTGKNRRELADALHRALSRELESLKAAN